MAELTFAQTQGLAPLPSQAELGTISKETVARLWNVIHAWTGYGSSSVYDPLNRDQEIVLKQWWVNAAHRMIDESPGDVEDWRKVLKAEVQGGFLRAYNLSQFLLDSRQFSEPFAIALSVALNESRAAYRVLDRKIVPFLSDAEHDQLVTAIKASGDIDAAGARAHLLTAGSRLTQGDWAASIQECIAAVESAARFVSGDHSRELGPILSKLRDNGIIKHGALAAALKQLYGYTSDEQGIRHSLVLKDEANVSEREAFLMLGLCASFVTYLLSLS